MRWVVWLGVLLSAHTAFAQDAPEPARIESPGIDRILQEFALDLANQFPEELRPAIDEIDLDGTDMRACIPRQSAEGELECNYHLIAFGVVRHPDRDQPYETRTLRPAEPTGPTIRYPRIAAFVALDFAIRRIIPLVLRGAGQDAEAARLAALESARTDAELAALEHESRRAFERLRALPDPPTREARRSLGRAKTASRVVWQSVGWLFRVHDFPMNRVLDRVVEVVGLAALTDREEALERTVEMLSRVAQVARSIRSWTSDPT